MTGVAWAAGTARHALQGAVEQALGSPEKYGDALDAVSVAAVCREALMQRVGTPS